MQHNAKSSPEMLLTTEQLAAYLGVPVATVYGWRHRGSGPPGYRVGRFSRYRVSDVEAWIEERKLGAAP